MEKNKNNRIVVKVGTSTLINSVTGKINLRHMHAIARVLSDMRNRGYEVILVSSGAIGVAMSKLGMIERPADTKVKQSLAAIGQCELMALYDNMFSDYHNTVAQILLTRSDVDSEDRREHMKNTFNTLLEMGIIPIVNENDTVAVEEIEFGDNDKLSAIVATLIDADILILFTDIDGLYDADPRSNPDAKLISRVEDIKSVEESAGGAGTNYGTGGMVTKIEAAKIANDAGISMLILNGENIDSLYDVMEGKKIGTLFKAYQV
ncbi:MAG TPA: glutamate 5-kinase [Candidatus Ornithomonoglobus merdipullorum]|uniref:Glutamate 5-kinase n=1 Tax=Candidatus Ornithomonoglobus merdipullorum TaxID=2840895 RepID=A0A9D1SFS4_9FIRM|nr:glutamate 5-kinase [Candidatus Ornithomonoglobus merdipullorum]